MKARCRSCGSTDLRTILSLGCTPLANALRTQEQLKLPEPEYPLELVLCPTCALVQITETVPPEMLFRNYLYFSSFSETVLENARDIAQRMVAERNLNEDSLVMEIASNDGYLLKNYLRMGIPIQGIEPAENIACIAEGQGIPTLREFFNEALAQTLDAQGLHADVIHANNVIAHVADLHGVVAGICLALKPDGVAVIEVHYVKELVDKVEFDAVYHEHLCYFSATSLEYLFRQHGLVLVDVERIPIHGGSLRAFFQRRDGQRTMERQGGTRVAQLLEEEASWGVGSDAFYSDFHAKVERVRQNLAALLSRIKADGKRIAVYGASAKSTTLLHYFGIGRETLEYVVDRSTAKQGLFTPGTRLPIHAPNRLLEDRPDYVLLLAWNFAEEIMRQQQAYLDLGGRFIIPIPELRVVQAG